MLWKLYKEKLLWLRLQHGWSQEEAAQRCGTPDKKQYHLWETGKTERPRARNIEGIVRGFELETSADILLQPGQVIAPELRIFYAAHFNRPDLHNPIATASIQNGARLICFSLDQTLTQGYQLSWKEVWGLLGKESVLRKKGLKLFHTGQMSYEGWCSWCCQIYRRHQITRAQLEALAGKFTLFPGVREGLQELRDSGFKLALVSGSLDVFLDVLLPDYSTLFDQVFINRSHFDANGIIRSMTPTPFDQERKADAIRYLCSLYGIEPAQSVYVGSAYIDKFVINAAGKTIAFNSTSDEIRDVFDITLDAAHFNTLVMHLKKLL